MHQMITIVSVRRHLELNQYDYVGQARNIELKLYLQGLSLFLLMKICLLLLILHLGSWSLFLADNELKNDQILHI